MIESIHFKNFRVLRDAELKLGPFNLLVGPNGSGKSTVFKALEVAKNPGLFRHELLKTASVDSQLVEVTTRWSYTETNYSSCDVWFENGYERRDERGKLLASGPDPLMALRAISFFDSIQIFAFEPTKFASAVTVAPRTILDKDGSNLAAALDSLRDISEESFDALKMEMHLWLPEFDSILFATPELGKKSFKLRQTLSKQAIRSADLSEGTLVALALLYLAYNPNSPSVICLEEPDRGLHPRLLRDLRDALYRLSYPKDTNRKPIQVIATTHSPYFLDLFKDHPEEIIIAEKQADVTAKFKNLASDPELIEIIGDAPLGEAWYTGILGGVPVRA